MQKPHVSKTTPGTIYYTHTIITQHVNYCIRHMDMYEINTLIPFTPGNPRNPGSPLAPG